MSPISMTLLLCLAAGPDDTFEALQREEAKQATPAAPSMDEAFDTHTEAAAPGSEAAGATVPGRSTAGAATPQAPATRHEPPPAVPAVTQRSDSKPGLDWRVIVGLGSDHQHGDAIEWFGTSPSPAAQLYGGRRLDRLLEGLGAYVGLGIWTRGNRSHPNALSIVHGEGEIGATLDLPAHGLWDLIYPYVRLGLILGYARVRAGDELADGVVVPGTSLSAGARLTFGRRTGRSRAQFFAFGEGGYAYRLPRTVKLTRADEDEEDPLLPGPAIRLGELALSGATWRVGLGVAF